MSLVNSLSKIFSSPIILFVGVLLGLSIYILIEKKEWVNQFIGKMKKDDIKFCEKCRAKNPRDNAFCEKCGEQFS